MSSFVLSPGVVVHVVFCFAVCLTGIGLVEHLLGFGAEVEVVPT